MMPIYMSFETLAEGMSAIREVRAGSRALKPRDIVELQAFDYGVETPVDNNSGSVTGKRQHKPVSITKEWGPSSPQLLHALVNSEVFTKLKINLYTSTKQSKYQPSMSIVLTNASIVGVKRVGQPVRHTQGRNTNELEEIQFAFQKIELSGLDQKITTKNDWTG